MTAAVCVFFVLVGIVIGMVVSRLLLIGYTVSPRLAANARQIERAARASRADRPALESLTAENLRSTIDRYYPAANRYGTPPSLGDFDHEDTEDFK